MNDTVIVDIDGTVCDRSAHDVWEQRNGDWEAMKQHCATVPHIPQMVDLVRELCWHYRVIFMTSRSEVLRPVTVEYIRQRQINYVDLVMRGMTDTTPDHIAKIEWCKALGLTKERVAFVLEDKQSVVDAFRAAGYICLQVAACDGRQDRPQPVVRRTNIWDRFAIAVGIKELEMK